MSRAAFVAFGGILLSLNVHAASFDCAKSATKVEKIICGDSGLSKLDEELAAVYKASLQDVKHAEVIKQSQKEWIRQSKGCSDAACLQKEYGIRLSLLKVKITTTTTGKLITGREEHTATLLPNGKVLIAGGYDVGTAELYDDATGRFTAAGTLVSAPRWGHAATLLPNGKVLIAGGVSSDSLHLIDLDDAELYDPVSGAFSPTGSFAIGKVSGFSSTLLANGRVLFAGLNGSGGGTAELYDPVSGTFSATGKLVTIRRGHTATLLPDGKVLLTGGTDANTNYLASAELYDPTTGTFNATGSLSDARADHTATLLPNGKVLVVGGNFVSTLLTSAELYDPATGCFTHAGNLITGRFSHIATILKNGKVLIAGGIGADGYLASIELYDPATGTFNSAGRLIAGRNHRTATLLQNGKVLIVGGDNTAEIYDPIAADL